MVEIMGRLKLQKAQVEPYQGVREVWSKEMTLRMMRHMSHKRVPLSLRAHASTYMET
jgi:hypothetical protein